ncbi:DUF2115 family protein [Methanobacterium sp.]|uniref:DUF2115 family protein n=1 Tax=Methanobacterium sp. TaxID=2164 RepID=UPI003158AC12
MEKYKPKMQDSGKKDSLNQVMSRYNLENFNKILNSSCNGLDEEVDEEKLKDLQNRIDHYFSLYAPDDEDFKEFIKAISIYLTFIAKKPLHPPGIVFSNGAFKISDFESPQTFMFGALKNQRFFEGPKPKVLTEGVYEKEGVYYCTGKRIFMKDKLSLCKYCVCKGID